MKDLKIKVCGMKDPDNMIKVSQLAPDYMGFIFYEKSPRNFDGEINKISKSIKKTGVFVNAEIEAIINKVIKFNFEAVQLHGDETVDFCIDLRKALILEGKTVELIKVFSIKNQFDFEDLVPFEDIIDYFLFDTKGENKGGNGVVFDWEILKKYQSSKPFILSGGIGLEQIPEIKKLQNWFAKNSKENVIYGVDLNSKFEIQPGLKNIELLKDFKQQLNTNS